MKKCNFFIIFGMALLLFSGAAWASEDTPAILASLNDAGVNVLDDAAIADIRGQAYPQYVMVKILGINTWDYSRDVDWTLNPLGYRYGYYGGLGWSNDGEDPVDEMDELFMYHDGGYLSDGALLALLNQKEGGPLPFDEYRGYGIWGDIYRPDNTDTDHYNYKIYVTRVSWMSAGARFFFGWRAMPLTEYARRQAVIGMGVVTALP